MSNATAHEFFTIRLRALSRHGIIGGMSRIILGALVVGALGMFILAPTRAATTDVQWVGTERGCVGHHTTYQFDFENHGDQARRVRVRVSGRPELTTSYTIAAGSNAASSYGVDRHERRTVTFRSEGQIVKRARMRSRC